MIIVCPQCSSSYKIDPSRSSKRVVRVKCPGCSHVFDVELQPSQRPPADADAPVEASTRTERPAVLIVDDARFFREMIRDILKELPVEMLFAEDGDTAWTLIQQEAPQLLLLDLNIPGKSGYELLRDIQGEPACKRMKVLVMSGVARGEEVAAEVARLGANEFLNKSFTPKGLQDCVCKLLGI